MTRLSIYYFINFQVLKTRTTLSSSMNNLIKPKKPHFKDLKDRITSSKIGIFSSLDKIDRPIKEEELTKPVGRLVKNFNEFLNFANKRSASDENPVIILTDPSKIDQFDESSPDDSTEYFPMTTSMTRELRLDLENLDRQVFGNKYQNLDLDDSSLSSDSSLEKTKCIKTEIENLEMPKTSSLLNKNKTDDIFVWENPLHESSPNLNKPCPTTPDEQADLDYDCEAPDIIDESKGLKNVTPIKVVKKSPKVKKQVIPNVEKFDEKIPEINGDVHLVTSCEEVTEIVKSNMLPPPNEFGGGNPFLMFLCITVLLQHREVIIRNNMDYNEMAMHFDKMIRKHNVNRVLNQARQMYAGYIKQHTIAQSES